MPIENDAEIRNILMRAKTIAVVGASDKPYRDSNRIAEYLMRKGYTVYPVNPAYKETNGVQCYPDLASLPVPVDIVDVFRNSNAVDEVVTQAISVKAKTVWRSGREQGRIGRHCCDHGSLYRRGLWSVGALSRCGESGSFVPLCDEWRGTLVLLIE
jgi:predicted CoA-binding protein